jgi:cytochrome P450
MSYWPVVKRLGSLIIPVKLVAARKEFHVWVKKSTLTRCEQETQRADFMSEILLHRADDIKGEKVDGSSSLTMGEITSNATTFLTAGTETSATALSSATYQVLSNPPVHAKLKSEIRSTFSSSDDITLDGVNKLPYLLAVIHEAMRIMVSRESFSPCFDTPETFHAPLRHESILIVTL